MYIWWFLKFVVFFCGKLTKPCHNAKLVSQQSLVSIINKTPQILTKQPSVATTVPSGIKTIIGALVYRVYLWIYDPGSSNHNHLETTVFFTELCEMTAHMSCRSLTQIQ